MNHIWIMNEFRTEFIWIVLLPYDPIHLFIASFTSEASSAVNAPSNFSPRRLALRSRQISALKRWNSRLQWPETNVGTTCNYPAVLEHFILFHMSSEDWYIILIRSPTCLPKSQDADGFWVLPAIFEPKVEERTCAPIGAFHATSAGQYRGILACRSGSRMTANLDPRHLYFTRMTSHL